MNILLIEDIMANVCWIICFVGWGISLRDTGRLLNIVREVAPWIETKKLQDGQDAFLASLKPEEQVKVIQDNDVESMHRRLGNTER